MSRDYFHVRQSDARSPRLNTTTQLPIATQSLLNRKYTPWIAYRGTCICKWVGIVKRELFNGRGGGSNYAFCFISYCVFLQCFSANNTGINMISFGRSQLCSYTTCNRTSGIFFLFAHAMRLAQFVYSAVTAAISNHINVLITVNLQFMWITKENILIVYLEI